MNNTIQNPQNTLIEDPCTTQNEWTAGRISTVIFLVALGAVLVYNAYIPDDIYFSDLDYEVIQSDRYEPKDDTSVNGRTLQIHTTYYPKGLSVNANSEIFLRIIPDGYTHFTAEIGIDAEVEEKNAASAIFSVLSDGALLYESPVLRSGMAPRLVHVPVEGRRTLVLKVSDAGDGSEYDRANWAMARFQVR